MKHKVKVAVEVEKQGLFGKKKVLEERIFEVGGNTYKKMEKKAGNRPYDIEETIFYDEIFDEWDD